MAGVPVIGQDGLMLQGDGVDVAGQLYAQVLQPLGRHVLNDQGDAEWLRFHATLITALLGQLTVSVDLMLARSTAEAALDCCGRMREVPAADNPGKVH